MSIVLDCTTGLLLFYLLGGYAASQIMVYNGNSILGEVNIKLYIGCTLEYIIDT